MNLDGLTHKISCISFCWSVSDWCPLTPKAWHNETLTFEITSHIGLSFLTEKAINSTLSLKSQSEIWNARFMGKRNVSLTVLVGATCASDYLQNGKMKVLSVGVQGKTKPVVQIVLLLWSHGSDHFSDQHPEGEEGLRLRWDKCNFAFHLLLMVILWYPSINH